MNRHSPIFLASLMSLVLGIAAEAATWKIDPVHSEVGFSVRHLMISNIKGKFKSFSGNLDFDPAKPTEAKVTVEIDMASVDTGNEKRDGHLKTADFFDVEKFPKMTFESIVVEPTGENTMTVKGNLTMKGKTNGIDLKVEKLGVGKGMGGEERAGFTATAVLNRKDYGVDWNKVLDSGGVVVGDEVKITLEIEAINEESATPPSPSPAK